MKSREGGGREILPWSSRLFVWLYGFLTSSSTTWIYRGRAQDLRLTILRDATPETELGDHDFCLSRSHYTDTDPTSRERAATAGIEPSTSSPGVARSTYWATAPPEAVAQSVMVHVRFNDVRQDGDRILPLDIYCLRKCWQPAVCNGISKLCLLKQWGGGGGGR